MSRSLAQLQASHFSDYSRDTNDAKFRKIYRILETRPPSTIVDVGCTNGAFLQPLVAKGWLCSGFELCEGPAEEARRKGVSVTVGDASQGLPFPDEAFDVVMAGEIVEHMIDDVAFLRELRRIAAPNGLIVVTTPNLVSLGNRILMSLGKMPRFAYADFHYRIYNERVLREKFRAADLQIQTIFGSYVGISRFKNETLGKVGEKAAYAFPRLSEHFIVSATKS